MTEYSCRICGLRQKIKPLANINKKYTIVKCRGCSFASVSPLPTNQELAQWYEHYHFKDAKAKEIKALERLSALYQPIIDFLVSKFDNGTKPEFLDYGFGKGAFLIQVAKNGYAATGIEISEDNCQALRNWSKHDGLDIEILKISDNSPNFSFSERFDCITVFSVVEHVLAPLELLSRLRALLKKGGILYLESPNNDALYLKIKNILRKRINREGFFDSLNPPQHLSGFNRRSMAELLSKTGYSVLEVNDYRSADRIHQAETIFYYPSLADIIFNKNLRNVYATLQYLHKMLDYPAHYLFGAGSGLFALARKT